MTNSSIDTSTTIQGYHAGQPILTAGASLESARAAMILIHGRGATADNILSLSEVFADQQDVAYFAPQAKGNTWYPYRFTEPLESNEPYLSSALSVIDALVAHIHKAGLPTEKIVLLGFSQGACLSVEYAARHAQRYGGVAVLSGGLIGPDGTPRNYDGSMSGTPVFFGCSDVDFHIPKQRVLDSAEIMRKLGADVTAKLYPNMDHTINDDELIHVAEILKKVRTA
jgi:predicted esterase